MAVALWCPLQESNLTLELNSYVLQVVQRDDDDPQREGREVVEEEPVAQRKKEPKKTGKVKWQEWQGN